MQHMLLENIEWDCDGMKPVEDCNLPLNVLAINVPPGGPGGMSEDEVESYLSELLSETYGFCHYGFTLRGIKLDDKNNRQAKQWSELAQAVMDATQ